MQAEGNGLHADVFPFLTEMGRALKLQFEPIDMVRCARNPDFNGYRDATAS